MRVPNSSTYELRDRVLFLDDSAEGAVVDIAHGCIKVHWDDGTDSVHPFDDNRIEKMTVEVIEHLDGDPTNNDVANLKVVKS